MTIYTSEFTSTKIAPYVYRLDNTITGEFYIGYRAKNKLPSSEDIGFKYFTSSKTIKPRFFEFTITIIAEFFDANDAYDFEQLLIFKSWKQPGSLNKSCYHGKLRFNTNGPATGKKAKGMNKTGKKAKGMPATGLYAKGMPQRHARGRNAKGMPKSEEHKKNISVAKKGVPNTGKKAKGTTEPKLECSHCCKWMNAGNLVRWHGDNCKLRPTESTMQL